MSRLRPIKPLLRRLGDNAYRASPALISGKPRELVHLTQFGHARPLLAALHPREVGRPVLGNVGVLACGDAAPHRHTRMPGACPSPAAVSAKQSREPPRGQGVASLIAASKLFASKAGMLWIRPRCWVEYQTENASIACGFGASTMSTKS